MSKACVAADANVPARQERGQEGGTRDAKAFAAQVEHSCCHVHLRPRRKDNLVKLQVVPDVRAERSASVRIHLSEGKLPLVQQLREREAAHGLGHALPPRRAVHEGAAVPPRVAADRGATQHGAHLRPGRLVVDGRVEQRHDRELEHLRRLARGRVRLVAASSLRALSMSS